MIEILGAIRSYNGIVILSESHSNPSQRTAVLPINDLCVAAVFRGKDAVSDFLEKYVRPKNPVSLQSVIDTIQTELTSHKNEYLQSNFSFFIAGYENETSFYHSVWFDNGKLNFLPIDRVSTFIDTIDELATYIVSKVYSEQMTVEELKKLTIFIALQCIKVFGVSSLFDITVISRDGVKTLSRNEVVDKLSDQDHKDNTLKKIFSDFFIMEDSTR